MRLWGGRFGEANDARVADFTRSIEVDRELAADDIAGSIAHVRGLGRAGLLTEDEVATLVEGLNALAADVAAGAIEWDPELEDVHLNLEAALAERVGPVAGKLHTGRSRNDQVATDLRLWLRRAIDRLDAALVDFERALVGLAERDGDGGPARARPTSSPPSRSCSPTTCSPTSRWPSATAAGWPTRGARLNVSPLGAGRARRRRLPARSRGDGRGARLRRRHRELARRGQRPRLRRRGARRRRARDGPPQPAGRGDHLVVEPAVRVRPGRRRVLDRQLDDAEQEEPGPGRAGPRPRRPRHRGADRGARRCSRACRSPTSATSRRTSRRCSTRSAVFERRLGVMAGLLETLTVDRERMRAAAEEGYTTATPSPTRSSGAASRSGRPTTSSARSWRGAEEAGIGLDGGARRR